MSRRVALIIAQRDGLVLFGKRSDNGRWTLPGGHVEEGEDPVDGARRELYEETGLEPEGELELLDEREGRNGVKLYTYGCEVKGTPHSENDPDNECGLWAFMDVADGIPKTVAENMQGPKNPDDNVAADLLGLAKAEDQIEALAKGNGADYRGLIDPQGQFHIVDDGEDHHDWIGRHYGVDPDDNDQAYGKARREGWIATGVAGGHNVYGNSDILNNPEHPAVRTARQIARQHFGPITEVMNEHGVKLHDTAAFVNQGKFNPVSPFRKSELAKHDTTTVHRIEFRPPEDEGDHGCLVGRGPWANRHTKLSLPLELQPGSDFAHHGSDFMRHLNNKSLSFGVTDPAHLNHWLPPPEMNVLQGMGYKVVSHQVPKRSVFHSKSGKQVAWLAGVSPMNKHEEDDEIDRLLMHPNPSERSMALKLHGVQQKHLVRALADEHPEIQAAAMKHPAMGHDSLLSLMQMPDRDHLQHMALKHPAIERRHLEALYHTVKDRPVPEKAKTLTAISQHPDLDSSLIERMLKDGNGDGAIENLNTPLHAIEKLIEQHFLDPNDSQAKARARRALKHPHAPAHLVEKAFKEGSNDVKIAVAQSQHLPEHLAQDVMQRGLLPAHDDEALLRSFIVQNPKASERHLKTATQDRNPLVRHAAKSRLGTFGKFESQMATFLGESLKKAVKPEDFKAIVRALDDKGAQLVDHKADLEAHPPIHNAQVAAYKHAVLDTPNVVRRVVGADESSTNTGLTKKAVYKVPDTHPTHGGARFLIKPYHERVPRSMHTVGKTPHQGWAEMTNQALYHAGNIGHLHQAVHTAEHNMGPGHEAEPALVTKMDPGWDVIGNRASAYRMATPDAKENVRRIAMMDFLTNNLDRHGGNLLYKQEGGGVRSHDDPKGYGWDQANKADVLAIDHTRSFQYANNKKYAGMKRRDQPREMTDNLGQYIESSGISPIDPLHVYDRASRPDLATPHDRHMDQLKRWGDTFQWWDANSDAIKGEMNKRLDQIKDPEVKAHIKRNFDARADHLDERARFGLENYGSNWYDDPVNLYRPGEISDDEKEARSQENL